MSKNPEDSPIPASPAKAFFVEMITRDIELQDAILDLIDNCVDGVRRTKTLKGDKPYKGCYAKITMNENEFIIEDNCGGIPLEVAQKYAFMMGRPNLDSDSAKNQTIGVYGIGMKRAIFKMGRSCKVHSQTQANNFVVSITPTWLDNDGDWHLPSRHSAERLPANGTRITITNLHKGIAQDFADGSDFLKNFPKAVRDAYSFLLAKGFVVEVNGDSIKANVPTLMWDFASKSEGLAPYIYEAKIDNVDVFLAVGFREKPEPDDADAEAHYRSEDAGWTIICNDRAILSCDKSRQTGWGWGGVPSFHTQFIAISGFVLLEGSPIDLPMTTTKRGVDANSHLFVTIRERMQEGILQFTRFTNEWKSIDTSHYFNRAKSVPISELPAFVEEKKVRLNTLQGYGRQKRAMPNLPKPERVITDKKIVFTRPIKQIAAVSMYLFETADRKPADVGAECFDFIFRKTQ